MEDSDGGQGQGGVRPWGSLRNAGSLVPGAHSWGNRGSEIGEDRSRPHDCEWKNQSPILPDTFFPGFKTLKIHPFPILDHCPWVC